MGERRDETKKTAARLAGGLRKVASLAALPVLVLVVGTVVGTVLADVGDEAETVVSAPETGQADQTVLVHRATPENTSANSTYLDQPSTDGNPDAVLFVTQSWNPGGEGGVYNDHPVGVWYDAGREQWAVFNQDREAMPEGAAFNVMVLTAP